MPEMTFLPLSTMAYRASLVVVHGAARGVCEDAEENEDVKVRHIAGVAAWGLGFGTQSRGNSERFRSAGPTSGPGFRYQSVRQLDPVSRELTNISRSRNVLEVQVQELDLA